MKLISQLIILLGLFLLPADVFSQDQVLLMNGKIVECKVKEANFSFVEIEYEKKNGKTKNKVIEGIDVFSVVYEGGKEQFIYEQDDEIGNEMSVEQIRMYIKGRREARLNWKAPGSTIGGVATGFVSGFVLDPFWAPILPVGYAAVVGSNSPAAEKLIVTNEADLNNKFFVRGYQKQARQLKAKNGFIGGAIGLVVGYLTRVVVSSASD